MARAVDYSQIDQLEQLLSGRRPQSMDSVDSMRADLKSQLEEAKKAPTQASTTDEMIAGLGPALLALVAGGGAGANAGMEAFKMGQNQIADSNKSLEDQRKAKLEGIGKMYEKTMDLEGKIYDRENTAMEKQKDRESRADLSKIVASQKPDKGLASATDLRKEFQNRSGVKDFNTVKTSYNKIQMAAENDSKAGDLSLIYGLMKLQDPTSTVRESETEMAQQIGGFPEKTKALFSQFTGKGRLTPEQRKAIVEEAGILAQAQAKSLADVESEFGDLAKTYKVDPRLIYQPQSQELLQAKPKPVQAHAQDSAAVQWAKANPNDPRSAAILKANGN